ncbi:hypothetical protein BgiBS90_009347 [Biomphalaria glabrata]|nr:hypothetical protein BgiBS90_009347 [Biomphalaria glabrata]
MCTKYTPVDQRHADLNKFYFVGKQKQRFQCLAKTSPPNFPRSRQRAKKIINNSNETAPSAHLHIAEALQVVKIGHPPPWHRAYHVTLSRFGYKNQVVVCFHFQDDVTGSDSGIGRNLLHPDIPGDFPECTAYVDENLLLHLIKCKKNN